MILLRSAGRVGARPSLCHDDSAGERRVEERAGHDVERSNAGPLLAVGGYVAARLAGLVVLAPWAGRRHIGLLHLLATRSDATWYLGIARHGYDAGQGQSNLAFFPLYPGLVAVVGRAVGWGAYPGLVVAWTAALVAAAGLFAVGDLVSGPRVGVVLAVLWGAVPHAVVETMGYSESLFTALAAWSLYGLLRRRWLTAGLLCAAAGLTRPSAAALVPVLVVDAVVVLVRERPGWRAWRPVTAALLAPLGTAGYLGWVAWRTGRLDGWTHLQRAGWGSSWDGGADAVQQAGHVLSGEQPLELFMVTGVVVTAVLLGVLCVVDRQAWQLTAYALASLAVTVGSAGYYYAKARFLLTAFPLLLPVAVSLARGGRARRWLVLVALVAGSAWFGGYLLLVWRWSP